MVLRAVAAAVTPRLAREVADIAEPLPVTLFHDVAAAPMGAPVTEVVALAKGPLAVGDVLDGIGGYGMLEDAATALHRTCCRWG